MEIWSLILACEGLDNEALVRNKYVIQREQTLDYSFHVWRHAFHTSWLSNLVEECCLWAVSSLIELFSPWLSPSEQTMTAGNPVAFNILKGGWLLFFAWICLLRFTWENIARIFCLVRASCIFKKHTGCFICSSSLTITLIIGIPNTHLQHFYIAERLRTPASPMGVSINSRSSKRRILLVQHGVFCLPHLRHNT